MPVEIVDYIFDRYKYLGLEPEASVKEIQAALRTRRAENHPDRLVNAGPEVKRTAEAVMEQLTACEDMLLKPERRKHYDARLAWFKTEKPHMVMPSYGEVAFLHAEYLSVDVLLGAVEHEVDTEFLDLLKTGLGVNDDTTAKLRRLYAKDPTDTDVREMLISALETDFAYYDEVEEHAWKVLGIFNKAKVKATGIIDPLDYVEAADATLDKVLAEEVPAVLGDTLALTRLGMAPAALLLTGPQVADAGYAVPARLEDVTVPDLVERVKLVVAAHRANITEVAQCKQALLTELAELIDVEWLTPEPRRPGDYLMLMQVAKKGQEPRVWMVFAANDHAKHLAPKPEHPLQGRLLSEVRSMRFDLDVVAFGVNPNLEMRLLAAGMVARKRRLELGVDEAVETT